MSWHLRIRPAYSELSDRILFIKDENGCLLDNYIQYLQKQASLQKAKHSDFSENRNFIWAKGMKRYLYISKGTNWIYTALNNDETPDKSLGEIAGTSWFQWDQKYQ